METVFIAISTETCKICKNYWATRYYYRPLFYPLFATTGLTTYRTAQVQNLIKKTTRQMHKLFTSHAHINSGQVLGPTPKSKNEKKVNIS
jgi:hypothetical protein